MPNTAAKSSQVTSLAGRTVSSGLVPSPFTLLLLAPAIVEPPQDRADTSGASPAARAGASVSPQTASQLASIW
ncbi:hypothetical protein GCM10009616_12810 [Microlunatus lacustris]